MLFSRCLFILAGVASTLAFHDPLLRRRAIDNGTEEAASNTTDVAPKRFIIEFKDEDEPSIMANGLAEKHDLKVLKVFNSDVFRGASIETTGDNLNSLEADEPAILRAWQAKEIVLAPVEPQQIYAGGDISGANMSIHHMTGVDQLHKRGIKGKGVIIAVVDSGVAYRHPALGGGIGPGYKIIGGYDLVGDGEWPRNPQRYPDYDPNDQLGHGTHVSGIIVGESSVFTGVAPEASVLAYKVFAKLDATSEDVLIEAFIRAYRDGADIITASIGSLGGWADDAWALVASRIVERGVVVTISAGNDGQAGPFAVSSGSSGTNVIAVASVDADVTSAPSFNVSFLLGGKYDNTTIPYRAPNAWYPSNIKGWPIIPVGVDPTVGNEACDPLPVNTRNFTGAIALVRRGGCDFSIKQRNLAEFGAYYVLTYTDERPVAIPTSNFLSGKIAMITREAGAAIIKNVKAGGNVTADFTTDPLKIVAGIANEQTGGAPSSFTSLGVTNDLFMKPDIAAPGGAILSTYLNNGYSVLSGTSMACPYVAGVAALYISKHGGRSANGPGFAKNLAMRIISSGESVRWQDTTGNYRNFQASVAQVGTGLINATKVLDYSTSLSFTKFALNDTRYFSKSHTVDITNRGNKPVTYRFSSQASGGMNAMNNNAATWGTPRITWGEEVLANPVNIAPSISFPGGTFTVEPGKTRQARISFTSPKSPGASDLPLYSGNVIITGNNGEALAVPYAGLAADLRQDTGDIFQYPIGFPTIVSTRAQIPIADKSNFTFDLDPDVQDFPNLYARLNFATRELRWDIFTSKWTEAQWSYPPTIGEGGYIGSATSWAGASSGKQFINATVDNTENLISLPTKDVPRSIVGAYGVRLWWLGQLADGKKIPPGKYKMRFAALLPFGDPQKSDDWDVYETPLIEVLPLDQ